jgi:hypothetical protein
MLRFAPLLLALLWVAPAHADRAGGDWSGDVHSVGNYFWERSTRVIVPTFGARVDAPNGIGVGADYLVDIITSASIAQTGSDEDALFTELRHGFRLAVDKESELGGEVLKVGVHGTYSTENDYKSLIYGMTGELSLANRNTTLKLGLTRTDDEVRSNADGFYKGEIDGLAINLGVEQMLSPVLMVSAGYDLGILMEEGGIRNIARESHIGLANPYRQVLVGPLPDAESHPDERWRHSAHVRVAWFIPHSDTALHLMHGAYYDSWGIAAMSPEMRIYQELWSPDILMRLRYRFYHQTAAFFQQDAYPAGFCDGKSTCYLTNDPKMTDFSTHSLGIKFDFWLSILEPTFLDFASKGSLFISFDRYWNSSRFGNGVIGQLGGMLPF